MKKLKELNLNKSRIIKKFIIDILNTTFFSNTICWGGTDQFNQLPIIMSDDGNKEDRTEQRYALFAHNRLPQALSLLVTVISGGRQQVCYRLVDIKKPIKIDDPEKTYVPMKYNRVDFSLADTDLGYERDSSYCFSDNIEKDEQESFSRIINLLKFILDSSLISIDDGHKLFKDSKIEILNYPPVPGDKHYRPIFAISNEDDS